jgi:toxin ParE1/3/4
MATAKVKWTNSATDDLYKLFDALSVYSDEKATSVVETIIEKVTLLESLPKMGRIVPELEIESIREILIHPYRVVYSLTVGGDVEVLAVRHSSRRFSIE